jgi:hypothetical protein
MKNQFNRLNKLFKQRGLKWALLSIISILPIQPILNPIIKLNRYIFKFLDNILIRLSGVHTHQLWKEREQVLEDYLAKKISGKKLNILEVGSWFGLGSTKKFIKHMNSSSNLFLVDPWEKYSRTDEIPTTSKMNIFVNSAYNSVYELVEKNKNKNIFIIKAQFEKLDDFLKEDYFDFIYIDGSHYYHSVMQDIKISKKIIKRGGVICGDDLDLGINETLYKIAKDNIEKDLYIFDDGRAFHPGVYLAVYDSFTKEQKSRIYTKNGFWALEVS